MDVNERKLRQEKIRLLKTKRKRTKIINEMSSKGIKITFDSFLDIHYSHELMRDLFNNKIYKLSEVEKEEYKFEHSKAKAVELLTHLKLKIPNKFLSNEIIMFHLNYDNSGAIILKLEDVFKDINWMIDFIGYSNGSFDFVVVEPYFNYGICIEGEAFENLDTYTIWGLFNYHENKFLQE